MSELVAELDPLRPANQREIRQLERQSGKDHLAQRIHIGKLLAISIALIPVVTLTVVEVSKVTGLDDRWSTPIGLLTFVIGYHTLICMLERGRMTWFLRE